MGKLGVVIGIILALISVIMFTDWVIQKQKTKRGKGKDSNGGNITPKIGDPAPETQPDELREEALPATQPLDLGVEMTEEGYVSEAVVNYS